MAKLYLIPTTLSNTIDHSGLLAHQLPHIRHLKHFVVETAKIARQHLKCLNLDTPLQQLQLEELNKHSQLNKQLLQPLLDGYDMGLLSDCGAPAIADPGSQLVMMAHQHNIEVIPLVGPSSIIMALMASGVNGQSFAFNGYLPIDTKFREQKIIELQSLVLNNSQSQIIIETPFRNQQLLSSLLSTLKHNITLCVAVNLMQETQQIISYTVENWLKKYHNNLPQLHKQEVVFVIGK